MGSKWLAAPVLGALVVAGCGSSSSAPTLPANGSYVGKLTTSALSAAGVDTVNVGAGGVWRLAISPTKLKLTSPSGDDTEYRVVAIAKDRLTLGGNPLCSVNSAQTQKSVYAVSTSPRGLRFSAIRVACKEDGGALTAGRWTKP
jgi:hypothetical protein